MALKFNQVAGEAKKSDVNYYKFEDGENRFRMVGDVLPRYVYWLKSPDNKTLAIECLSFDRELERFTNIEKDWVTDFKPDEKCSWSYLVQVVDLDEKDPTKRVKVLGLKKKLFQQIIELAEKHYGDPTDPETGWDCVVNRKKTGPLPFNVEYTLDQLSSKPRELDDEEKEAIKDLKGIDELFPRPKPEEQKAFLDKVFLGEKEDDGNTDNEAVKEFEDVPY